MDNRTIDLMFATGRNDQATPQWLFDELDGEFSFTLDAAASQANAKCETYFTVNEDALQRDWAVFTCNCLHEMQEDATRRVFALWPEQGEEERPTVVVQGLPEDCSQSEDAMASNQRACQSARREDEAPSQPTRPRVETLSQSDRQPSSQGTNPAVPVDAHGLARVLGGVGQPLRVLWGWGDTGARPCDPTGGPAVSWDSTVEHGAGVQSLQQSETARAAKCPRCGIPGRFATVYVNPPYQRGVQCLFIAKAVEQAAKGATVVMLLPSRTDTAYFHEFIWDREAHMPKRGVQIRFLKGRLKFNGATNSAPFPSIVVIFRPTY
jgi:hypothetical protein